MFSFLGLAEKLGKPRWIVWENVPGCLSSGEPKGSDFGCLIQGLVELGYGVSWRILDAQYFGVPQRRRRVFVVACLGDWRAAAEVLSLREGLRGYLETGNKKRKGVTADAGASVEAGGLPRTVGTICADTHPGAYTGQDAYTGRLIPAINPATNVQPYTASSFAQYAEGVGTVRASGGDLGGGSETLLTEPVPFRKSKRACSTTDNERVEAEALAVTTSSPLHFDTYNQTTSNISFTLSCSASDANHTGTVFVPNMAVRRLTPTECLRLQGFPDGWSQIPWKGKPAEECPDGPQYKACGNSMAVPVMRWIGERIAAYELSQNHETK
jgi:DNA (cytosine-5)-methyltransferase 1